MKNSVTRERNVVMCLLIAGVLSGKFTHVTDAFQAIDDTRNDSKFNTININICEVKALNPADVKVISLFSFL